VIDHASHGEEQDLHRSGQEIGERGRPTAIGDVHHVDARIILNSSPCRCDVTPMPPDPMLILPGWALASLIGSGIVRAGKDGCTTSTLGVRAMPATGAMSWMRLKLRFL
jgi:hypothetical protein